MEQRNNGSLASRIAIALLATAAAGSLSAQSAGITQIDTGRLMAFQDVRLYARVLDASGAPQEAPAPSSLRVWESPDGVNFSDVGALRVVKSATRDQGISFLFLVDNSGSMYDGMDGKPAAAAADTRAAAARKAAEDFLLSVNSGRDSVGLAAFNTRYSLVSAPDRDRTAAGKALDKVLKPGTEDAYTELYASIVQASADLGRIRGRRALVVLSDGENFPYFQRSGKDSPQFGRRTFRPDDAVKEAVLQGVTVFAVNFGSVKDSKLGEIAAQTGGDSFDAADAAELSGAYAKIRERILTEVMVEYGAKMFPGDRRWVKMAYGDPPPSLPADSTAARWYYAGTVFGRNAVAYSAWVLLAIPLALLALFLISLVRFEKPSLSANLSLLYAPGIGKGTRMFNVGDRTVIGSDETADITLAGNSRLESSPVTVAKDPSSGRYTITGQEALTVNNRQVKEKTLEPGDVINFNGTMVVFDDADTSALLTKERTGTGKRPGPGAGKKPPAKKK